MRKGTLALLLVLAFAVSACAATLAPETSVQEPAPVEEAAQEVVQEAVPETEASSNEVGEAAPSAVEEATEAEASTGPVAEEETSTQAVAGPAWFNAELTDVKTGQTFKIADFQGKVILIETMAVWCPFCTQQQQQTQALHTQLGERDDFVSLSLDVDPNESNDILKVHSERNGFGWLFAVAPTAVAREIGQLYGGQYLNPPATPMLIIDRQGQAHTLPFGIKDAGALQDAVTQFLNQG
jgi:peroxiredoxin